MLQIVGGLVLLGVGGEFVVRGAVGVARRLGVSELMIGLTLVGFGTSTPELITSINAALRGSTDVAVGNVVGSNISNVLLIAAVTATFVPIAVQRAAVMRDGVMMIISAAMLAAYVMVQPIIEWWAGAIGVSLLIWYLWSTWLRERRTTTPSAELHREEAQLRGPPAPRLGISMLLALVGVVALIFGADYLVRGAITLARLAGMSETVIGLTIVAVGTSLPEFVATLASAIKGKSDVAFGNVVGSNIYNVLGILGITAIVKPLPVPPDLTWIDWSVFVGSAVLLVIHALTGSRVRRIEGASLLLLYVAYVAYLVLRSG
ncbi:calcium/sodium antiporter [Terricaulis sp.]|uniref:calcium/sodium antiporter n=1 Tax=Terricaulis sp. TaxID=2768686 RepID=UPI003782F037